MCTTHGLLVGIVRKSPFALCVAELPQRWTVEQTFARFGQHSHPSKAYAARLASSEERNFVAIVDRILEHFTPSIRRVPVQPLGVCPKLYLQKYSSYFDWWKADQTLWSEALGKYNRCMQIGRRLGKLPLYVHLWQFGISRWANSARRGVCHCGQQEDYPKSVCKAFWALTTSSIRSGKWIHAPS